MSAFPVVVTSVNRRTNNSYAIALPTVLDLNEYSVGVGSAYIYYSWYNINGTTLNNNVFKLDIPGMSQQTITIPDGAYDISTLNSYLQYWFIQNGLYITNNTTGVNTYYASFSVSPSSYKVQLNTTVIQNALPSGYTSGGTNMTNAFTNSAGLKHIQFTILSTNNLKDILGINAGTYPTSATGNPSTYTKESDYIPNVNPINAVQMRLSCAYNLFSSNTNLIHVFTNKDAKIGEQIDASPLEVNYVPCMGSHKELVLAFYDQAGRVLDLLDPNIVVKILFKKN
jgi:hypothetical protein